MTTEEERYQEFMDRCVNASDNRPGATRIDTPSERDVNPIALEASQNTTRELHTIIWKAGLR
jgi:hypothetical protein